MRSLGFEASLEISTSRALGSVPAPSISGIMFIYSGLLLRRVGDMYIYPPSIDDYINRWILLFWIGCNLDLLCSGWFNVSIVMYNKY